MYKVGVAYSHDALSWRVVSCALSAKAQRRSLGVSWCTVSRTVWVPSSTFKRSGQWVNPAKALAGAWAYVKQEQASLEQELYELATSSPEVIASYGLPSIGNMTREEYLCTLKTALLDS